LISSLLSLTKRHGKKYGKNIIIELPIGHKEIANSIAMTRETASRDLEKLTQKRIISQKCHFIVINDLKKLKRELKLA
jgi:CRP-like cAMP-binding protein